MAEHESDPAEPGPDLTAPAHAPAPALRVLGGGEPSAEELAAVVVALTPRGADDDAGPRTAPWRRAALIEGVGGRPPTSPSDLDVAAMRG